MDSKVCVKCQKEQPITEFKGRGRPRLFGIVLNPLPTCADCRLGSKHRKAVKKYQDSEAGKLSARISALRSRRERNIKTIEAEHPEMAALWREQVEIEIKVLLGTRNETPTSSV